MDFNEFIINAGTPILIASIAGLYLLVYKVKSYIKEEVGNAEEKIQKEIGLARQVIREEADDTVKNILHSIEHTTSELKEVIQSLNNTINIQTQVLQQMARDNAEDHAKTAAVLEQISRKL